MCLCNPFSNDSDRRVTLILCHHDNLDDHNLNFRSLDYEVRYTRTSRISHSTIICSIKIKTSVIVLYCLHYFIPDIILSESPAVVF